MWGGFHCFLRSRRMGAGVSTKKKPVVDAVAANDAAADAQEPKDTHEDDAHAAGVAGGALAEVSALLAAYQIDSTDDLLRIDAKYHSLKAMGAHRFGLLQGLHVELHTIHSEKEGKLHLSNVVAQARERVTFLMRQVTSEAFNNFVCCVDGSSQSDIAYEVLFTLWGGVAAPVFISPIVPIVLVYPAHVPSGALFFSSNHFMCC